MLIYEVIHRAMKQPPVTNIRCDRCGNYHQCEYTYGYPATNDAKSGNDALSQIAAEATRRKARVVFISGDSNAASAMLEFNLSSEAE